MKKKNTLNFDVFMIFTLLIISILMFSCQTPSSGSSGGGGGGGHSNENSKISSIDRTHPQVFAAWGDIENRDNEDKETHIARHNLAWISENGIWQTNEPHPHVGLAIQFDPSDLQDEADRLNRIRTMNPRIKILCEIRYFSGHLISSTLETEKIWENGYFPDDSAFWLKDGSGNVALFYGDWYYVDFTNSSVQDIIAEKALALKNTGLFDGIFLDNWREQVHGSSTQNLITAENEWNARLAILQKIRAKVGNDFLIIVNGMTKQLPNSASYLNGIYMECLKPDYDQSYTAAEIVTIENALMWAENASLMTPRVNCLEGQRKVIDLNADKATRVMERNNTENTQMMRLFTTMSLTLSDGYVLFGDDNEMPISDHIHNWYSFWDISLGNPLSPKNQKYKGISGLYIREYEKGWAIYNRSGSSQHITFATQVTGETGGIKSTDQDIQDMDGEIYLK